MNAMIKRISRILFFGFLTWGIPFASAFFFYTKDKTLLIPLPLFKTLMVLIGALIGALCITWYFLSVKKRFLAHGILIGFVWLSINLLLDTFVLVPMAGYTWGGYIIDIGLRYLSIPITTITVGYILERKVKAV